MTRKVQMHEDVAGRMLAESAERYYRERGGERPARPAPDAEAAGRDWSRCVELGWNAVTLPEAAGGAGLGLLEAGQLAQALGRFAAREPVLASGLLPSLLLRHLDGAGAAVPVQWLLEGHRRLVVVWQENRSVAGGALAATPPPPPHSMRACLTAATAGWRLHGRGHVISGWGDAVQLLVVADLHDRPTVVHVARSAPGIAVEARPEAGGGRQADLVFDDVPIERDALVASGDRVTSAIDDAVRGATIAEAAYATGLGLGAIRCTVDYLKARRQFDAPLASFQALRHRIADLAIEGELAGASWRSAARTFDAAGGGDAATVAAVHAAKASASAFALAAAKSGLQLHGAIGYTAEADIGIYLNGALAAAARFGDARYHWRAVALAGDAGGTR